MKPFMDEHFLLTNEVSEELFHRYARQMPIMDYHCHLDPKEISEDRRYRNLTELWLYGDHYKWRAMRANGIEEQYVTGGENVADYSRFLAWAQTVPMTIGNPLFHWSHLELQRWFGITDLINEANAPAIWEQVNSQLQAPEFTVRQMIRRMNVEVICTTDDPADSLEYHHALTSTPDLGFSVLPSFRPDRALEINRSTFLPWLDKLRQACDKPIADYEQLLAALTERVAYFHAAGGRVSDHALDFVPYADTTFAEASAIFAKALAGLNVSAEEECKYKTYTLLHLGRLYAQHGWAMQLHINAHRNNNARLFERLGPDTGFDSINDSLIARPLVRLLDTLDKERALPKTILYSLNPRDNDVLAAIIGSFQGDGIPGKIQFGSAWWFNDTKDGMQEQMSKLANMGLLSRFVGMLTDSRSFLSYTRHEYFRRILCDMLGVWVQRGEVPHDIAWLGQIVQGVCYGNAKAYFQFPDRRRI